MLLQYIQRLKIRSNRVAIQDTNNSYLDTNFQDGNLNPTASTSTEGK